MAEYSRMRSFDCAAYTITSKEHGIKLDTTSKIVIFWNLPEEWKITRLWDPVARKMIINNNVFFNESNLLKEV